MTAVCFWMFLSLFPGGLGLPLSPSHCLPGGDTGEDNMNVGGFSNKDGGPHLASNLKLLCVRMTEVADSSSL